VDDAALLQRARKGDEAAFSQLFARHHRAIRRYAAYMSSGDSGDDVVQETFLAVLRQTGRGDSVQGTVAAYLFGIARHVVVKRWAARDTVLFADPDDARLAEAQAPDQPSALDDLARAETIAAVRAAVQSLPAAYREVVLLCELQEMDYADAAGVIGCPIGTVRSRLSRARALLASKLASVKGNADA
jgi:RNA polymerase sigma-70 factor (ECF subfamily)